MPARSDTTRRHEQWMSTRAPESPTSRQPVHRTRVSRNSREPCAPVRYSGHRRKPRKSPRLALARVGDDNDLTHPCDPQGSEPKAGSCQTLWQVFEERLPSRCCAREAVCPREAGDAGEPMRRVTQGSHCWATLRGDTRGQPLCTCSAPRCASSAAQPGHRRLSDPSVTRSTKLERPQRLGETTAGRHDTNRAPKHCRHIGDLRPAAHCTSGRADSRGKEG